ncbi:Peroxisomal acyl-coenzyme A oxidase 1 [Cyphellophora attinorum]|uniref:Acyl-coenzyme A oxidase n=1 Tax=Cyphellophora attinorum TaxID=1664694 RepID=A0A0N1HUF3_9EURO|nr:Peroxisomal acyl-coenzyme A oxidase 1 [Phialophora attinorum]KPI40545.1 Peroxisomal acyl-coenzyme A oxidase 1 [Phialophora attinorum]
MDFSDELKPADPQGPDILRQERVSSGLDAAQLARHLLHRDGFLERQAKILSIIEKRPLFNKKNLLNLARPHRYHIALARSKELRRLSLQHGWSLQDFKMAEWLVGEVNPYSLHTVMFMTSIREQANEEQLKLWQPRVDSWEIIGCYSQTELGHGSNVRGVETQAIWNSETKDFTIHSPTLTAAKWWNGSLGRTANHAIIIAQLMLPENGKLVSYGPHQFVAQIRDMKTNKPLEGLVIGDINAKVGYAGMDNGYMLFKNFKIPHSALLSRHTGITLDGKYIKPKNQAIVYGSMTFVRAQIIMDCRMGLGRACTIAVRYLSIRRQFADRDGSSPEELAVLNYPSVQMRVLPLLATVYALHYTGESMFNLYWATRSSVDKGDFSRLAELHAASSGLKSCCTLLVADGNEVCRRALGGHGFAGASGMIPITTDHLDKPTVEGDSFMISQQTASYLIKRVESCVKSTEASVGEPVDHHIRAFLQGSGPRHYDIYNKDSDILDAFRYRFAYLAHKAYQGRVEQKQSWTSLMVSLHRLSQAWSECILIENFYNAMFGARPDPPIAEATHTVLKDVFRLFALSTIDKQGTEFVVSGALRPEQLADLTPTIQRIMKAVRPHAVPLMDAFSIPDYLLDSALGRYDGDVYRAMWQRSHLENPLNVEIFNPDFRSEEIIMGEGEETARKRLEAMANGTFGHEQRLAPRAKI